jgi:ferrochelatase
MSIGKYVQQANAADAGVTIAPILDWHLLPGYVRALADRVQTAVQCFPAEVRDAVPVIFTAHSLPERIRSWNDPYPDQLAATVEAVMALLGERPHRFAYQSATMTPDPWLGPDVGDVVEELARDGVRDILVAPIGFVCEHVEILYDIDLALQERASQLGVRLERIELLNDHPQMIADLARLVRARAVEAGWL